MNNRNSVNVLETVSHDKELLVLFIGMVLTGVMLLTMIIVTVSCIF